MWEPVGSRRCGSSLHDPSMQSSSLERGTMLQWNDAKGFGFIKPENGGEDVFCHVSALLHGEGSVEEGDEVQYKCWNSSDTMRAYVQSHYGDLSEASWNKLWNVFQAQMLESTSKRQRTVIQWEGAFKSGLAMGPKTTVQAWLGPAAIASATKAGHQVIASEYNYWYYYDYCLPSTLFALN